MKNGGIIGTLVTLGIFAVTLYQDFGGVRHSLAMTVGWYGKKMTYNQSELYYTSSVTEAEAKKLGDYLLKEKFFEGDAKSVQLTKEKDVYEFRAVIKKEYINNAEYEKIFKEFDDLVSKDVFDSKPVEMHLCDQYFTTVKVIK